MGTFRHKAIYGATGSGKTTLMKRRAAHLLKYKQQVLVYTGTGDISFPKGCKLTMDPDELEEWLKDPANYGAFIMLDEAAVLYDEVRSARKHPAVHGLFMRGRHKGYTCYIATQYPTSIPRRNRVNCSECFCFKLGDEESAKLVWMDYGRPDFGGRPAWETIMQQKPYEFLHIISPDHIEQIKP